MVAMSPPCWPSAARPPAFAGHFRISRLFREMTSLENVMIGLHASTRAEIFHALLRTRSSAARRKRSRHARVEALAFVGLSHVADQPAGSLPYGHQRLLEIARAFVRRNRA